VQFVKDSSAVKSIVGVSVSRRFGMDNNRQASNALCDATHTQTCSRLLEFGSQQLPLTPQN